MKALLAFISFTILHCHSSQLEMKKPAQNAGEQPRILSIETGEKIYGELLVSLPLTIILPSLVMKQSLFAAKNLPNVDSNGTMETILQTLGAESLECQQRLICDMIASPKKYRPLSDIIYLMLRNDVPSQNDLLRGRLDTKLFEDYRQGFVAGRHAFQAASSSEGACERSFRSCKTPAPNLDTSMLKYWQRISDFVPLTITV